MKTLLLIFASTLSILLGATYENEFVLPRNSTRRLRSTKGKERILPNAVVPISYNIRIRPVFHPDPDFQQFTAPGKVFIAVQCLESTDRIILHKHPTLEIGEATLQVTNTNIGLGYQRRMRLNSQVTGSNGSIQDVAGVDYDETTEFFRILLSQKLSPGEQYQIRIDFTSLIEHTQDGLYLGKYGNSMGVMRTFVMTDLEPFGARRVFPCFDEPRYKTRFKISIARKRLPENYITMSNAEVEQRGVPDPELPKDWVWDHYKETVPMCTYLLAVIVSDFSFKEAPQGLFCKPIRVYAPPHLVKGGNVDFSVQALAKLMKFYEHLFGHPYEMQKLDAVAIPNHLENGAMENWGLVTFSEEYLAYYRGRTLEEDRLEMLSTIAHELSHQWLGNLVTCKWWSELWLNEGLATYFQYSGVKSIFPEFDYTREFLWESVQKAMAYDAHTNFPLTSMEDVLFMPPDTIVYDKSASLVRMMEGFLGRETLMRGLVNYFNQFAYRSVTQNDLFTTLSTQAEADNKLPKNLTINIIMHAWVFETGFPLIRIVKESNSSVRLTQEIFGEHPKIKKPSTLLQYGKSGNWIVPISIVTHNCPDFSDHSPKAWLTAERISVLYPHDTSKWIMLNPDAMGYYRTIYDDELGKLILDQLVRNRTAISGLSRSQLIDDYFNLAKLGYIPIAKALEMTTFLKGEDDFIVWYTTFTALEKALAVFRNEDMSSFKSYMVPLIESALDAISWDQKKNEKGTSVIFRSKLLYWACTLDSFECINKARELLIKWAAKPTKSPIPPEHRPIMYCTIVAHGGSVAFDFIWKLYTNSSLPLWHKGLIMNALACSRAPSTLNNLLVSAIDPESDLGQNTKDFLAQVAMNPFGRLPLLRFIRSYFRQLKSHTNGTVVFAETVRALSNQFTKDSEKIQLEKVLQHKQSELEDGSVPSILNSSLRTLEDNIRWKRQYYDDMNSWFKHQGF